MLLARIYDYLNSPFSSNQSNAAPTATIAEIALAQNAEGQFETLVAALVATDSVNGLLTAASDPNADITVFAPTDEAFRATASELGLDVSSLADGAEIANALVDALGAATVSEVLKYHVKVGGSTVADLQGETVVTLADAALVDGNTFTVSGSKLDDQDPGVSNPEFIAGLTDIAATNGVVQAIDRVLLPSDLDEPTEPTIAQVALSALEGDNGFATLVAALQATQSAGLNMFLDVASDPNADITVLAPTNAAFRATAEALGADTTGLEDGADIANVLVGALGAETISNILAYHVVLDGKSLSDLQGSKVVETALDGSYLGFDGTNVVDVDSDSAPMIVAEDIATSNGKIQVVDTVLLPVDLAADGKEREFGSRKDDFISTGSGNDNVFARKGDDVIITNDGNDKVFAGRGKDLVFSGSDDDLVFAGRGSDVIVSGAGDDRVFAGRGNDVIVDGAGNDVYFGGRGADTFDFIDIQGDNTVRGFGRSDTLVFSAEEFASVEEVLAYAQDSRSGVEFDFGDDSVFVQTRLGVEDLNIEIA